MLPRVQEKASVWRGLLSFKGFLHQKHVRAKVLEGRCLGLRQGLIWLGPGWGPLSTHFSLVSAYKWPWALLSTLHFGSCQTGTL